MSYADIEIRIIQWAEARKIIPNSNPESQLLKVLLVMSWSALSITALFKTSIW